MAKTAATQDPKTETAAGQPEAEAQTADATAAQTEAEAQADVDADVHAEADAQPEADVDAPAEPEAAPYAGRRLARNTVVTDPDNGARVRLYEGDTVPDKYAHLITNPNLFLTEGGEDSQVLRAALDHLHKPDLAGIAEQYGLDVGGKGLKADIIEAIIASPETVAGIADQLDLGQDPEDEG